jgi:hypothetical protein
MNGRIVFSMLLVLLLMPGLAFSEEEKASERPWKDSTELSIVQTGGNSESLTIGFKNLYEYKWANALFTLKAGGIKAENTVFTRYALISPTVIVENEITEKTAENYYINGQYNKNISNNFFWFAGAGWDRNEFSGIENRYAAFGGVGNIWIDTEIRKFKTDYGFQFTKESAVFEPAGFDDTYVAARFSYNYFQKIFQSSSFNEDLELIANLDETSDFRLSLLNSLTTALNSYISLKVSLDFFYDNEPAFQGIPILAPDPINPVNLIQTGTTQFELDELDYIFTTALVITF